MGNTLYEKIRKRQWQDIALFVAALFFTVFYFCLFSNFEQLPSEYYGGDHYAHLGSAIKIYDTFNPFISSHYYGELQHYPWLVPFFIAFLAKITFRDPLSVAIYFPIFILLATLLITYFFGIRFFQNKTVALLFSLSWGVQLVPSFHPSEFAKQLMIPLLALFILLLWPQQGFVSRKRSIIAGIIYGFAGLEHMVTFFVVTILYLFLFLFFLIQKKKSEERKGVLQSFFLIGIIGIFLASLFWLPLYLKYQGQTVNEWQEYTSLSVYPDSSIIISLFSELVHYSSFVLSLFSFIAILFVFFISIRKKDFRVFIPLLLILATFLGTIHPYVTYPLFGLSLGYYRFPIVLPFVKHLLLFLCLYYGWHYFVAPKMEKMQNIRTRKLFYYSMWGIAFLWIVFSFVFLIRTYTQSERYEHAIRDDERMQGYVALRKYIHEYEIIGEQDVIVGLHPSVAFLFNGMTGKNVMVTTVTHASPFVDHNKRAADMAVLLYGNDSIKALEIINEYQLTYLFSEIANFEFRRLCLENWNFIISDTTKDKTVYTYGCLQTDIKYKAYAEGYGLETTTAFVHLASGSEGEDLPLQEVLVIKPGNLTLSIQEVYAYTGYAGKPLLKLYKIT